MVVDAGPSYFLRWQFPVCALIVGAAAGAAALFLSRSPATIFKATQFYLPSWRNVHPVVLLIFRAVAAIFMSFMLHHLIILHGPWIFYFYTVWTFTLVTVYFLMATCISAYGCWIYLMKRLPEIDSSNNDDNNNKDVDGDGDESTAGAGAVAAAASSVSIHSRLQNVNGDHTERLPVEVKEQNAGFWEYAMQVIYQTCAGAVILTDVVFWCLLVPFTNSDAFSLNLINDIIHSLNLVLLIIDTFLGSLPFLWPWMAYFVLYSCIYVAFQWILHACGFTWWPYPFLNLSTPWAPFWYLGVSLVHIPLYGLYILIVRAKCTWMPKLFPNTYIAYQA